MALDKKRIEAEFEKDKEAINTVIGKSKEVKEVKKDKNHKIISKTKKLVDSRGRELVSFYGKRLKVNKRLHGNPYIAKAGMLYDEIPSDFKLSVTFQESDFN